jgi:DNA polymerase-3 subunit beta
MCSLKEFHVKFEIQRPVFEAVLSKASSVLATKDLLPILKNFQLTVGPGYFRTVATDLELSVIAKTELVNCIEAGRVVFPGRRLIEIVKSCEDEIVTVAVQNNIAVVTCAGATWNVNLMASEDYPEVPDVEDIVAVDVQRLTLINALTKVKGAAAKEGVRPALQMVDISNGNVRASDGAIFRQVCMPELAEMKMQIPLGAVEDLVKLLRNNEAEKLGIGQTEDHLLFIIGDGVFIITKNNLEYPDVEGMLLGPARSNKSRLTADRQQLIAGIRRVRINADADTKGVAFVLTENSLDLRTHDKYGNAADQILEVQYVSSERTFGVNHENLLDVLQVVDSPLVTIMLGDDSRARKAPLFIEDGDVVAVLQQIKLDS